MRADVEAVGEEGAVAGVGLLSASIRLTVRIMWSASPEKRLPRLAPPSASSPCPRRVTPFDLGAVLRRRAGHERAVSFSTQRKAGMSSFEPSRIPAWVAPVCEERSGSHSASRCDRPRASAPASARALAHRPLQHRQRKAVDLEEDDAGRVGHDPLARAPRDALHDAQRVDVVVVRAEDGREDDADRRRGERDPERRPERVDRQPRADRSASEQHPGVEEQDEEEADQRGEREPQRGDERRQDGVEHGEGAATAGRRRTSSRTRRARASSATTRERLRAATRARAVPPGSEAARASSPAPRRTPRSRTGLAGVRRLGRLLRAALLLLLGLAALGLGIRVGDEPCRRPTPTPRS